MNTIPNYAPPQFTLEQKLRPRRVRTNRRNRAVALGTQYLLSFVDGRDLPTTTFGSAGATLAYTYIEDAVEKTLGAAHQVKADSVKVWGQHLEAQYVTSLTAISEGSAVDRLVMDSGNLAGSSGLNAVFVDRQVAVGDILEVRVDHSNAVWATADETLKRKVVSLIPAQTAAAAAGPTASAQNVGTVATAGIEAVTALPANYSAPAVVSADSEAYLTRGGRYNGNLGDEFVLTVTDAATYEFSVFSLKLGATETVVAAKLGDVYTLVLDALYVGTEISVEKSVALVNGETLHVGINPAFTPAAAPFVLGGSFNGASDRAYTLEVVIGSDGSNPDDAVIRFYDASGKEPIQSYDNTNAVRALGTEGLTITPAGTADLVAGDVYLVAATAPQDIVEQYNGVILDGPAYDATQFAGGSFQVDFRAPFTGYLDEDTNLAAVNPLTVTDSDVSYPSALGLVDGANLHPFVDGEGTVSPVFKAAVIPAAAEAAVTISDSSDLSLLGEVHPENDLAYGAMLLLSGADDAVSAVRVLEDTSEAFITALKKITSADLYYSLAILSDHIDVAQTVRDHCELQSNKSNQNWRICFFGTDSPGAQAWWGELPGGGYRQATLAGTTVTLRVDDRPTSNFVTDSVRIGDIIRFAAHGDFTITYIVDNGYEVIVSNPGGASVGAASAFSVIKPETPDNTADYVIRNSRALNSRRAINVWIDRGTATVGGFTTRIPNKFLAAEIAGTRVRVEAQQGLSNSTVTAITAAPSMHTQFDQDTLNRIAAAGTWIVTQRTPSGEVFTRHQLTTDVSAQIAWEGHAVVVHDAYCFLQKDAFAGFVGKRNVTADTVRNIYDALENISIVATQSPINDPVGPLIQYFSDEDGVRGQVTARADQDFADKILTYSLIGVAMPLNDLEGTSEMEASILI